MLFGIMTLQFILPPVKAFRGWFWNPVLLMLSLRKSGLRFLNCFS